MAVRDLPGFPQVQHLGEVSDIYGVRVHVGVDHGAVTIGRYTLAADGASYKRFAQLLETAVAAARTQAETRCQGVCCPPGPEED